MKQLTLRFGYKAILSMIMLTCIQVYTWAQNSPDVKINGEDAGSWIGRNWLWCLLAVVGLILLIGLFSSSSRTRRTTVVKENDGLVSRTTSTTTEVED